MNVYQAFNTAVKNGWHIHCCPEEKRIIVEGKESAFHAEAMYHSEKGPITPASAFITAIERAKKKR